MSGVWYGRCWFSSGVLREGRSASANLTGPHTSVGTPRIEPIGSHTQFPPHAHAVCDGAFPCGLPLSLLAFVPSPVLQRSTTRARPQHVLRAPRSRTDGFALRGLVRIKGTGQKGLLVPRGGTNKSSQGSVQPINLCKRTFLMLQGRSFFIGLWAELTPKSIYSCRPASDRR